MVYLFPTKKFIVREMWTFHSFICFHHYGNISSCFFTNSYCLSMEKLVPCSWIYKMFRKERLQHGKVLYWNHAAFWIFVQNITFQKLKNWIFICHMFTSSEKITVQVNGMPRLWVDTISLTANAHVIIQKDVR